MKNKSMLTYQIKSIAGSLSIFYLILLGLMIIVGGMSSSTLSTVVDGNIVTTTKVSMSGTEAATIIFVFIMGLCSFSESFCFFKQAGYNRKDISKSFLLVNIIVCFAASIIDQIVGVIIRIIVGLNEKVEFETLYEILFSERVKTLSPVLVIIESIIFFTLAYLTTILVARVIVICFYRANKNIRALIAAGIPITVFFAFPMIDTFLFKSAISKFLGELMPKIFGLSSQNPYIGVLTMVIMTVILGTVNHLLTMRVQVKTR